MTNGFLTVGTLIVLAAFRAPVKAFLLHPSTIRCNGYLYSLNPSSSSEPITDCRITQLPTFTQLDVIYGSKTTLMYDAKQERFLPTNTIRNELQDIVVDKTLEGLRFLSPMVNSRPIKKVRKIFAYHILPYISVAFVPDGVTPAFYRYTRWRVLQRWINANLQVFGTQSLLLGLGIKTKSLAALSAALNWVLKDALGKAVRLIWASKMGSRFDSDAKRWRLRAGFLHALGNGMEIACYVFPRVFLPLAACANCAKEMSRLTCSSTRTALYNSFRDGTRENIGDITAKGEASIAVVDLLGIATGVSLSTKVGTSVGAVLAVYVVLQSMEILCIYNMMRSVQFRVLNFERLCYVLNDFIAAQLVQQPSSTFEEMKSISASNTMELPLPVHTNGSLHQMKQSTISAIKTPEEMALKEKILKPPAHLARRALAFGSLGRARLDPDELEGLLNIFSRERFLLVVGKNMKHPRRGLIKKMMRHFYALDSPSQAIQENCHIVLHAEATKADIVKSSLALMLLRHKLSTLSWPNPDLIRSRDCLDLIQESCQQANRLLPRLLRQLADKGWTSPARFLFDQVTMRADWPIQNNKATAQMQQK